MSKRYGVRIENTCLWFTGFKDGIKVLGGESQAKPFATREQADAQAYLLGKKFNQSTIKRKTL